MLIQRETLGSVEFIDLDTDAGWDHFVNVVVQNEELAKKYREKLEDTGMVITNYDQPLFIERWIHVTI